MTRFAFVLGMVWMLAASASAQRAPTTISADDNGIQVKGPAEGVEDIHYHVFEPRQFRLSVSRTF